MQRIFTERRRFIHSLNTRTLYKVDAVPMRVFIKNNREVRNKIYLNISNVFFNGGKLVDEKIIIKIGAFESVLHNYNNKQQLNNFITEVKSYVQDINIPLLTSEMINSFLNSYKEQHTEDFYLVKSKIIELKPKEIKKVPFIKTQSITNKHNRIFKNNAFEVWQKMYDDFNIIKSSRTNIKFMFEVMLKDELIHNTVTQVRYLQWIYDTYNIEVQRTSNYSKTQERKSIYYNAKQLYTT